MLDSKSCGVARSASIYSISGVSAYMKACEYCMSSRARVPLEFARGND